MAKKSSVEKNKNRGLLVEKFREKRAALKAAAADKNASSEDRFKATLKLAQLPRNGARIRLRNRCALTGRPRGYYRKLGLSRIALRSMSSEGLIPGVVKASW